MQAKYLCVLIHIRTKGEVGTSPLVKNIFADRSKAVLFFVDLFRVCHAFLSVHCSLVVTCWERAGLLALLYIMFYCVFVTFPFGFQGQCGT